MDHVNIYTLTGFKSPSQKAGAYTYVLELMRDGRPVTRDQTGMLYHTTGNCAALTVILMALRRMKKECELTIYTDSLYMENARNGNAGAWQAAGWKKSNGDQVKNAAEWAELVEMLPEGTEIRIRERHSYYAWMQDCIRKEEKRADDAERDRQKLQGRKEQEHPAEDPGRTEYVPEITDHRDPGRGGNPDRGGKGGN